MGFSITWKLILVGLFGRDQISALLTCEEMFDYLDEKLNVIDEKTDDIILVICERDDIIRAKTVVQKLAKKEHSELSLQIRKWRAYILKDTLDNLNSDFLQAILQLMNFWVLMGMPKDCPQEFPLQNNKLSKKEYFTRKMLEIIISQNTEWLKNEVDDIINIEKGQKLKQYN